VLRSYLEDNGGDREGSVWEAAEKGVKCKSAVKRKLSV
jgi:hypothetical protein